MCNRVEVPNRTPTNSSDWRRKFVCAEKKVSGSEKKENRKERASAESGWQSIHDRPVIGRAPFGGREDRRQPGSSRPALRAARRSAGERAEMAGRGVAQDPGIARDQGRGQRARARDQQPISRVAVERLVQERGQDGRGGGQRRQPYPRQPKHTLEPGQRLEVQANPAFAHQQTDLQAETGETRTSPRPAASSIAATLSRVIGEPASSQSSTWVSSRSISDAGCRPRRRAAPRPPARSDRPRAWSQPSLDARPRVSAA